MYVSCRCRALLLEMLRKLTAVRNEFFAWSTKLHRYRAPEIAGINKVCRFRIRLIVAVGLSVELYERLTWRSQWHGGHIVSTEHAGRFLAPFPCPLLFSNISHTHHITTTTRRDRDPSSFPSASILTVPFTWAVWAQYKNAIRWVSCGHCQSAEPEVCRCQSSASQG